MKIFAKLMLIFSGVGLIISVIDFYYINSTAKGILETEIREKLEDHAFHTMDKIDRMLYEKYENIRLLAKDPVISSPNSNTEDITEKIKEFKKERASYTSVSFFDFKRIRKADTEGKDVGRQHALEEFWPEIMAGSDFVYNIYESESTKVPVIYFAHTVKDKQGTPFGVVVTRMSTDKLYEITKFTGDKIQGEKSSEIDLIDQNGLILYSNYNLKGILKNKAPDWELIKRFISTGQKEGTATHVSPEDREPKIYAFARERGHLDIKGRGWTLVIGIPVRVALSSAAALTNKLVITLIATISSILLTIFLFSRTISRPIEKLSYAAAEIGRGNLDEKVEITSADEVGLLALSFNNMAMNLRDSRDRLLTASSALTLKVKELEKTEERLQLELAEREKAEEKIRYMLLTDELTGLYNKRGFLTFAQQELEMAKRTKQEVVLLFADIDGFKRLKDNLGHEKGDMALIDVANILKDTFRESDVIARMGADEFTVLAIKTSKADAKLPAERLEENIDAFNKKEERPYKLSLSIGTVLYDSTYPQSIDELLSYTDDIVYQKRSKSGS